MARTQDAILVAPHPGPAVSPAAAAVVPRDDEAAPRLPDRVRRARERLVGDAVEPRPLPVGWQNWYSYWS
jgi:hypothetical protein